MDSIHFYQLPREDDVVLTADQANFPWVWSPIRPTDAEPMSNTSAFDIRDSSKCTADSAGLDKGGENKHRLKNAWREGQCKDPGSCGHG